MEEGVKDQAFVLTAKVSGGEMTGVPVPCDAVRILNGRWNEDVRLPYFRDPAPMSVSTRQITRLRIDDNVLAQLRLTREDCFVDPIKTELGTYHPYMQRTSSVVGYSPCLDLLTFPGTRETLDDLKTVLESLCDRLLAIFSVVEPAQTNMEVYGYEIRSLLFLACTEVENQIKQVLLANGYPDGRLSTRDYVKTCDPLRLRDYGVRLTRYGVQEFRPFAKWVSSDSTKSIAWYDAYNKAKHDRLKNANCATLSAVIESVAAVFVLAKAKFGHLPFLDTHLSRLMKVSDISFPTDELYFALMEDDKSGRKRLIPKNYSF